MKKAIKDTRNVNRKRKLWWTFSKRTKRILFAVCSSLLIGTLFGFISLHLAKQEKVYEATKAYSTTNEMAKKDEQTKLQKLNGALFFVIQGGVFSNQDNARQISNQFQEAGFPAVHWEKEDHIYLLTGINATKEGAVQLSEAMKEKGFDVFVKEWQVDSQEAALSTRDFQFLQDFHQLWGAALDDNNQIRTEQWENLLEQSNGVSDHLAPFINKMKAALREDDFNPPAFLLETMYEYNHVIKNI